MSNNTEIQSRNTDLTTLLNKIKALSGGVTLTSTTFSFANSGSKLYKSRLADNNIDLTGLLAMTANLHSPKIKVPSQSGSLTYTGYALSPTWSNYDSSFMTVSGTTSATNAGTYTATFTPKSGYAWSDGTTAAKNVTWTIGKAAGSLSISKTSITLNASTTSTTFTVTRAGNGTITVTSSNTNVATATLSGTTVTVKSVNSTTGTATITVKVAAGTNHTAPSNKTCSVTASFIPQLSATYDSYANVSSLTDAQSDYAFGTVGNYAVVAGGYIEDTDELVNSVCYVTPALATGTATSLYESVTNAATGQLPSYFLVIGGVNVLDGSSSETTDRINAYNSSLTRSSLYASDYAHGVRGQQIGNYCVYSVGELADSSPASTPVDAISNSLTKTSCSNLTYGALTPSSGRTTNHVVICGGQGDVEASRTQLNFYSSTLVKTTGTSSAGFYSAAYGNTENKAIFEVNEETAYAISDNGTVTTFTGDTTIYVHSFDSKEIPHSVTYDGLAVFTSSDGLVAYDDTLVKQTVACGSTYSSIGGMGLIGDTLFNARHSTSSIRVRTFNLSTT